MKIEDLIQLLNNRLREFKLSKDYARMSGNLERMNAADKEIIGLEDTLYQLNLLVDASKSATVKEATLTEVITDGSVAVLAEYDITSYATDPEHEVKIMNILSKMGVMDTVEKIDSYIQGRYLSSPVTGEMIMSAALAYTVDARLMMAIIQQDSQFGTEGLAVRTLNPGNVGNDDAGNIRTYESWQEGVTAVAEWLSRHRGSTIIPGFSIETLTSPTATSTPQVATTTPPVITQTSTSTPATSTGTSTPIITTSTTTTATTTPATGTSTPSTSTSTTTTATSTPSTNTGTSTPSTSTSTTTPATNTSTSTPSTSTSTTTPATNAPGTNTSTSTPSTSTSTTTPGTTPANNTSTSTPTTTPTNPPEITPPATSTPTIENGTPVAPATTPDSSPQTEPPAAAILTTTTVTTLTDTISPSQVSVTAN